MSGRVLTDAWIETGLTATCHSPKNIVASSRTRGLKLEALAAAIEGLAGRVLTDAWIETVILFVILLVIIQSRPHGRVD